MKTNLKRILALLFVCAMVFACFGCAAEPAEPQDQPAEPQDQPEETGANYDKLNKLFDHVYEVGTYTELDTEYAEKYFSENNDNWGGGCTASAKKLDDGTMLFGRNMDLTVSHKCAYVLRTKAEGLYETLGLTYTFREVSPTLAEVEKNGVGEQYGKLMPFLSDDVLNSEGLYIEVNMRYGEENEDGTARFSSSGTNPGGERVYVFSLPIYVGTHCANVEEALEYIKTLDLYSQDHYWNYCFMIGDATGRYGLLEIAQNRVIWEEGQQAQANFYVDPTLQKQEELRCGTGRYDKVMEGIDAVTNEDEMFALMDSVSYFQVYDPDNCRFDYRSEYAKQEYGLTHEVLMDENNRVFLENICRDLCEPYTRMSREELMNLESCWESIFTEVVNCREKTIHVRFYENDDMTLDLKLGD